MARPSARRAGNRPARVGNEGGSVMDQQQVFDAIATERQFQDRKWGTIDQHPHEVGAWLTLMSVHLRRAQEAWAGSSNDHTALIELRKVLGIGVACAEQHGIPARAKAQPVQKMRESEQ